MPVQFFDITRQNSDLKTSLGQALSETVNVGRYILGQNVSELEKEFAAYCGTKYAIGVASGTDALHLALRACGVGPGDEVITTPFTFVATAEAIAYCGATPVFVDIEPKTFNMAPAKIEEKLTAKTKAILPIHLYGQACAMDKIMDIAHRHRLHIVEDCAQACGAEFNQQKVGSFGSAGCFSFFPTKNLGCFGDGGMVTTNDPQLAEAIKILRGHGSRTTYHYDIIGYNSRLDELQAAILRVKLAHLPFYIKRRRENAALYYDNLQGVSSVTLPFELEKALHTFNQFTLRLQEREKLIAHLKQEGIGSMVYYPLSLHLQKAFSPLGHHEGDFPACELTQAEVLSLPIYPELTEKEILAVCSAIKKFFGA